MYVCVRASAFVCVCVCARVRACRPACACVRVCGAVSSLHTYTHGEMGFICCGLYVSLKNFTGGGGYFDEFAGPVFQATHPTLGIRRQIWVCTVCLK